MPTQGDLDLAVAGEGALGSTTLQNGVEYTFTARLFDQMDTTDPKKALASDSQKYKFGDPEKKFPGLF